MMNLIFLGPPGAGKGTLAARVKEAYSIPHISTGDLFRDAIRNETELGKRVKAILDSGDLVPDEVTVEMVRRRLQEKDAQNGFILDGFPRTIGQAESLEDFARIDAVINLIVEKDLLITRLSGRRIAKQSGRVYHIHYNPPKVQGKCDETGEKLIQRPDDKPEAIENRLEVYRTQTEPLIAFYREKNILHDVDASPSPEAVYDSLRPFLDGLS
jgi:adenylate kinase